MPELPDVEIMRRRVEEGGLRREIAKVDVTASRLLKDISPSQLAKALRGHKFTKTRRHGKHLFLGTESDTWLELHFGMTGDVALYGEDSEPPKHDRVDVTFTNGSHLGVLSQRKFGHLRLVEAPRHFVEEEALGPDALEISENEFVARLHDKRGAIKAALLDQTVLAGIGNVYGDEALFHARIHPKSAVEKLGDTALRKLYSAMQNVLKTAIRKQADPQAMPQDWLLPNRQDGAGCPSCDGHISKTTVSGRSTYFCGHCQQQA